MMGSGNRGVEREINDLKQAIDELTREEDDIKEQLQLLESHDKKRSIDVDYWLEEVGELKERARGALESVILGGLTRISPQQLTEELRACKEEKPLVLSNEWVGDNFKENVKYVWELLGDDKVFKIGVHGMGGVGKTCLVALIEDEITRRSSFNFRHVFWVTASRGISNLELQTLVAKRIGIKLDEDNERTRAKILFAGLMKKEKSLFILDNVWSYIDTEKVGIPFKVKGNKLILTSRLKHVCRQMDCHIVGMKLLTNTESWELFSLKHGFHGIPSIFPTKVLEIARRVAKECGGLPLGISVMARTMRGVNDIHRWRHALNKLENSKMRVEEEMEEEVFKMLKLSYDNLDDTCMRECFLCCAIFIDGDFVERKDLIMNFVEEGVINGMRRLEEIFDEGHAILDKLVDHSLLHEGEDEDGFQGLRMHGMMRNIASHILEERGTRHMLKCDQLEKMLDMREWRADLVKVSLMNHKIKQIPEGTSPHCPNLSTLIFGYCPYTSLNSIPDCFFSHMNALTILDLSYNERLECLPTSVANMRSLISLLLKECRLLKNVPPLGQLQKLSRLVISGTSIEQVPQGLETLINLKWLDLSHNHNLTFQPGFVLPSLTNMQYLDLGSKKVEIQDIQGMSKLEYVRVWFHDSNNYNDFVRNSMTKEDFRLEYYEIVLMEDFMDIDTFEFDTSELSWELMKRVSFGDCEEFPYLLPTDLTELDIKGNEKWRCLCPIGFWCSRNCSMYKSHLQFPRGENGGPFRHLTSFYISGCHQMEKLMSPVALNQLQNLESLSVSCCDSMREIFSNDDDDDDDVSSTIRLPKLTRLELFALPQLKSVWKGSIVCGSRQVLDIEHCRSLDRDRLPTIKLNTTLS